jgi:GT2 family glycosyltransferase
MDAPLLFLMNTLLSVVIITRNRPEYVPNCLQRVRAQDYAPLEIVVVDASDDDRTECIIRALADLTYVHLQGAANQMPRSRNEGILRSHGEILAFIDDDSLVSPEWARHLMAHYASARVGGVGGMILEPNERPALSGTLPTLSATGSQRGHFNLLSPEAVEISHLRGCNMSFRRSVLMQVGGFDPRFDGANVREETDMCVRVTKAGYRLIYDPAVAVTHLLAPKESYERNTFSTRYLYSDVKNTTYFRLKHFLSWRTLAAAYVGSLGLAARNAFSQFGWAGVRIVLIEVIGRWAGTWTWLKASAGRSQVNLLFHNRP